MDKICTTEDVPEREARSYITSEGDTIVIIQYDGNFYAYRNICPHLHVELEFLENQFLDRDREFIECSTHGALFNITNGECMSGPCLGEFLTSINIQVHSDGGIYLTQ